MKHQQPRHWTIITGQCENSCRLSKECHDSRSLVWRLWVRQMKPCLNESLTLGGHSNAICAIHMTVATFGDENGQSPAYLPQRRALWVMPITGRVAGWLAMTCCKANRTCADDLSVLLMLKIWPAVVLIKYCPRLPASSSLLLQVNVPEDSSLWSPRFCWEQCAF